MRGRTGMRGTTGARTRRGAVAIAVAATAVLTATATGWQPPAATASSGPPVEVIVVAGSTSQAAGAVRAAGGDVVLALPIVDGVSASVPAGAVGSLAATPGVRSVTPDREVRLAEGTSSSGNQSTVNSVFAREINADKLRGRGVDGTGVTVALVDTGVSSPAVDTVPVDDPFDAMPPRATVPCVNFSGEPHCEDSYGHGTFVAGLIAGKPLTPTDPYGGVAPGAGVLSIKIAGRDGSADVTRVLAAIQWVVSFREQYGIRVLNLSLGTDGTGHYTVDPLNLAVQRAWVDGIVVVVAASNRGPAAGTVSKPGDDPYVLTVGAVDDRETPAIDDDRVPDFSARGPAFGGEVPKPDVVAPGARLVSLRSALAGGSRIDELVPTAPPFAGTPYRRGSGTSMSAAVVSGAAALLVDADDGWGPNRVKQALRQTARKVASNDPAAVGRGLVDADAASKWVPAQPVVEHTSVLSAGDGDLDDSRGNVRVQLDCPFPFDLIDPACQDDVAGDEKGNGGEFDSGEYGPDDPWNGSSWYESQWVGSSWYGSSWYGSSWYEADFTGSSWYSQQDEQPYGATLEGSSWYGAWG